VHGQVSRARDRHEADGHWHINDPEQIYLNKDTTDGKTAWEDYVKYVQMVGRPWLRDQQIYDAFTTGTRDPR